MKLAMVATKPWRSGQEISNVAVGRVIGDRVAIFLGRQGDKRAEEAGGELLKSKIR